MSTEVPQTSSSEMLESRQAAMKNRIITHMNADHSFSLEIYLRHFCGVPQKQASNAKLTEITSDHMILESRAGRNLISFNPPMNSLMEAREKVVALHKQAMAGLGLSDTKVDTFAPPNRLWQVLTCGAVILCLTTLPLRSQLPPSSNSLISKIWSLGGLVPGLATLAYKLSPFTLIFIYIVHTLEAENFARTRLRKHQVPTGSMVWCLWIVYVWIGGVACFTRFDELVRQQEEQNKKDGKH